MRKATLLIVLLYFPACISHANLNPPQDPQPVKEAPAPPVEDSHPVPTIYRLIGIRGNEMGFCTATVVAENRIITAGHCLEGMDQVFLFDEAGDPGPEVKGAWIHPQYTGFGTPDLAVLEAKISPSECSMSHKWKQDKNVITGFPGKGTQTWSHVSLYVEDRSMFMVKGMLFKGMSGGVMYDPETCTLLGILSFLYENMETAGIVRFTEGVEKWIQNPQQHP